MAVGAGAEALVAAERRAGGGRVRRIAADGVLAMAAGAGRRQRREVAAQVAVDARQQAMHAHQLAADARVLEARAGEAALRVALAATGPERVVVDVVVAMAADAQLRRAGEQPPARVTL